MSAPFQNFLAANALGEALGAYDALAALEMGRGPLGMFAHHAGQGMHKQHLHNALHFLASQGYSCHKGGGAEDAEEMGADDDPILDAEIASSEEEMGDICGDSDECGGDSKEELGADLHSINHKIAKARYHIEKWEMKLASTPEHRVHKRRRIHKHLQHLRKHLQKLEARRDRKIQKIAAKLGMNPAMVAAALAGGSAAAAAGVGGGQLREIQVASRMLDEAAGNSAFGVSGRQERVQFERSETRIPFVDSTTGSPVVAIQVAAGAGVRTAAVNMVTQSIPYARFRVKSLDIDLNFQQSNQSTGVGLAEALINMLISQLVVNGGLNLFYNTQSIKFVGQSIDNHASSRRTLTGLRKQPIMERTNTCVLAGTFRQESTTTVVLNATFQAALICDVEEDDEVTGRVQ